MGDVGADWRDFFFLFGGGVSPGSCVWAEVEASVFRKLRLATLTAV